MEIAIKSIALFGAVILVGLSAGFFFAWSVSVIPGTQHISDTSYLQTMQSINRAILNPIFFLVFFGSMVFLSVASVYQFSVSALAFWLMLASSIFYLFGTIAVTGMGNVPLNDRLDVLTLSSLKEADLSAFRTYYESRWNKLHSIRTAFAILSFLLAVLSVFTTLKKIR